jgi:AraC-like DNA-binding protein
MAVAADVFRRLCAARELLRESAEPLSIAAVARASGMSPYHFIRRYDAVFGATPHQARIDARVDRAKHLLAGGELSVTEVCLEVGFSSLGSFSSLFARRVGEAPSSYRRRVRTSISVPGALAPFPGCLTLMQFLPAGAFRSFREAAPA